MNWERLLIAYLIARRLRRKGERKMPKTVQVKGKKFDGGQLLFTPGALELASQGYNLFRPLARHFAGDWGDLCDHDRRENDLALDKHLRLFSVYQLDDGVKIWIITEADRSATTILRPSEY